MKRADAVNAAYELTSKLRASIPNDHGTYDVEEGGQQIAEIDASLRQFQLESINQTSGIAQGDSELIDLEDMESPDSDWFDEACEITRAQVLNLEAGQSLRYGGGAAPLMEITRVVQRWHVETVSAGVVINAEALDFEAEAKALAAQRTIDIAEDNERLLRAYGEQCRASVLELDDSDSIPSLIQYDYIYRVAPCTYRLEQCCACLELPLETKEQN